MSDRAEWEPSEVVDPESTLEAHLAAHAGRSRSIYVAVLVLIFLSCALLPVIRVSVAVQARGLLRPVLEKQEVRAQSGGVVVRSTLLHDRRVEAGEPLVQLHSPALAEQRKLVEAAIERRLHALDDLTEAWKGLDDPSAPPGSTSSPYFHEYVLYRAERARLEKELEHEEREAARLRTLLTRQLVSTAEVELGQLEVDRRRSEIRILDWRYGAERSAAAAQERTRLDELLVELTRIDGEQELLRVHAPVTGTLEQVASLSAGSYVRAGDLLAIVSPEGELVAEVHVPPEDVALIDPAAPLRLHLDSSLPGHQGFLTGSLASLSNDYLMIDGRPVYRALIRLDPGAVRQLDGTGAEVRKGMTLTARFIVGERTLWQLLRDDLSDWLDPRRSHRTSPR